MAHSPALKAAPTQRKEQEPAAQPAERAPSSWVEMYGLSRDPFLDAPGPDSPYTLFASHRRCFELAAEHLLNGRGILTLAGEAGAGKSAMLQALMRLTRDQAVGSETARPVPAMVVRGPDPGTAEALEDLLTRPEKTRRMLLIDDFDRMTPEGTVLLKSGPLRDATVIAAVTIDQGAPPLQKTDRPEVRMPRLTQAEMRDFIERTLWVAGGSTRRLLSADALRIIILRSDGLPGTANRLLEAAFTTGFVRGDAIVSARTMEAAIGVRRIRRSYVPTERLDVLIPAASGLVFAAGLGFFVYRAVTPPVAPPAPPPVQQALPATPAVKTDPVPSMPPEMMAALMRRGEQSLALGDIAAARLLFSHAAEAGNAAAATAAGKTYDPNVLSTIPNQTEKPDPARAAAWYRKAVALGDPQAQALLQGLPPS